MLKKPTLLLVLITVGLASYAQIETDRPDFTESPNVVPKGALQIESGFIYETNRTNFVSLDEEGHQIDRAITLNTTLFRYGINDRFELRLNWSIDKMYVHEFVHPLVDVSAEFFDPAKGLSSTFVGVKTNLYKSDKVSVGLLSHIYIPSLRSGDFSKGFGEFIAPEFLIPCSIDLTDKLGIAFQYGLSWSGVEPGATTSYTFALGYGVTDKLSSYVEPYGYIDKDGNELHLINGGFTYLVTDNFLIDLTGGLGLNEEAPDNFIGCGASLLINKK
jgi:hypothetical protein